ncbi:hypothetical protein ACFW1A_38700 [Kitasatospora sp. NPDC058965]|uniref:hypothetical protein n=1 Tax=Kitasatospora sp. NPDC058965 TaxID=3346682 RepID=UPI0036BCA3EB
MAEPRTAHRRTAHRRTALAGAVGLLALLATGCGIRPTAVPVDAGAPASRTACPSPVHPPAAPASPAVGAMKGTGRPFADLTATPTPAPSAPGGSLFSAQPTPVPSPSGTLRCE